MKREDVRSKIPGITDEQLQWLMDEHGKGITREKNVAAGIQEQLDAANATLKTAQDSLKAFEGVDVTELQGKVTQLQNQLDEQQKNYAFDTALDTAIRNAKGRNVKAIRGMLDIEALRKSEKLDEDLTSALKALSESDGWAFGESSSPAGGMSVSTGGEHGQGGNAGDQDGVVAAFARLNPGLKL